MGEHLLTLSPVCNCESVNHAESEEGTASCTARQRLQPKGMSGRYQVALAV